MNIANLQASELVLHPDGSIYHLNLHPENLATTIITVGDPDRVALVSRYFDTIDFKTKKREFVTHTGTVNNKRISVVSTGIGTDNIDIVLNELDALVNIDLNNRQPKKVFTPLQIIRIGTSGAFQATIPVDSYVASEWAVGLDNLLHFYDYQETIAAATLRKALPSIGRNIHPYVISGAESLLKTVGKNMVKGITVTCPGFYGPQNRYLRAKPAFPDFMDDFANWKTAKHRLTNFEMETAGIYGMAHLLGHKALSTNAIIANRANGTFSKNPKQTTIKLIEQVLERISHEMEL